MSTVIVEFCPVTLRQHMVKAAMAVALFASAVVLANCWAGCMPARDPSAVEQEYVNAIVACAATSGYPGAYDPDGDSRCRARVDCQYGVGPC